MSGFELVLFIVLWTGLFYLYSKIDDLSDDVKKIQRDIKSLDIMSK
jgi:hypothetical protein